VAAHFFTRIARMTVYASWISAAALYLAFHAWYVGFGRRLSAGEIERACAVIRSIEPDKESLLRTFFEQDRGGEFFMVNLIRLRRDLPAGADARALLMKYQKPFLGTLLRSGGHPIAFCRAAAAAVECWGIDDASEWDAAVLVRYRSRRDLAQIISTPMFRSQHPFKLEAIGKTFAFPGDPARILVGGPRLLVPLLLFALAAGLTLALR
jgi:hypothetical protein